MWIFFWKTDDWLDFRCMLVTMSFYQQYLCYRSWNCVTGNC